MDPNIQSQTTQPAQPVQSETPIAQPNLPQQPINEFPHSKSKFKLILLIVILLIIVGAGAYLLGTKQNTLLSQNKQKLTSTIAQTSPTPIPDPTANWKTYSNDFFSFRLKYPNGWKLSWEDNTPRHILATNEDFHMSNVTFVSTDGTSLTLDLQENSNFHTNEEYLAFLNNGKPIIASPKNKIINLDNKIEVSIGTMFGGGAGQEGSYYSAVSFFRDGKTYNISMSNHSSSQENLLKQILSTFKFTDQNQTDPTPSLNIKYPRPSPQPIPLGLEDELFTAYNQGLAKLGQGPIARYNFSLKTYYGDVAEGKRFYATDPSQKEGVGSGNWTMNKNNGEWIIVRVSTIQPPYCSELKAIINELRDWQKVGSCFKASGNGLINITDPNDLQNNDY